MRLCLSHRGLVPTQEHLDQTVLRFPFPGIATLPPCGVSIQTFSRAYRRASFLVGRCNLPASHVCPGQTAVCARGPTATPRQAPGVCREGESQRAAAGTSRSSACSFLLAKGRLFPSQEITSVPGYKGASNPGKHPVWDPPNWLASNANMQMLWMFEKWSQGCLGNFIH